MKTNDYGPQWLDQVPQPQVHWDPGVVGKAMANYVGNTIILNSTPDEVALVTTAVNDGGISLAEDLFDRYDNTNGGYYVSTDCAGIGSRS